MKSYLRVGLAVLLGVVVGIAPFLLASAFWWPAVGGLAVFGVIVAATATATKGVRVGIGFTLLFAVIGTLAVLFSGSPLLAALLVAGCAYGIAMATLYSLAGPMLVATMFVPYLIHQRPEVFTDGSRDSGYFAATLLVLLAAGLWGCVLTRIVRRHKDFPAEHPAPSRRDAVLAGALVAGVTGIITFVALTRFAGTEWVWILMTILVLTKPTPDLNWAKTKSRVVGTMIGVAAASVIGAFGLPGQVTTTLGVLAMTVGITLALEGEAYWLYSSFTTPAVILFDSAAAGNTADIAVQRLVFTVVGAIFAVALGAAINSFVAHDAATTSGEPANGR